MPDDTIKPIPAKDTPTTQLGTLDDLNTPPKEASNTQYILAVVIMFLVGVIGVVLISLFNKTQDLGVVITAVFGLLTPTTLSLLSFMKSQETHLSVNSRLDGFIKNAQVAALLTGRAQGIVQGTDTANARTDMLQTK